MASSCREARAAGVRLAAALALAAAAVAPRPALAQAPSLTLAGHVERVRGTDTLPVAGQRVVAHRVGGPHEGPLDSVRSDARGQFSFRVARPDTGVMYVVSTLYQGIGYFSAPFATTSRAGADTIRLQVFDTSSTGSPLDVAVRHLVISAADKDGSRDVLDIIQVGNPGTTTRVARPGAPTWGMVLPHGIENFRVGEGDVPPDAVRQKGDSLLVAAPFPPGIKQVVAIYVVPQGLAALRVPVDQTARLEILMEDSLANASGAALAAGTPLEMQGRTFRHFSSTQVVRGATALITFGPPGGGRNLTWLAIALAALLLGSGAFLAVRRRGGPAPAPAAAAGTARDQDALLRQIVALDERYASRRAETPPAEWAAYQAKRTALKAEIAGRVARR